MRATLLLLVPTCLLGCVEPEDDPRESMLYHTATAWRVTPGGVMRDAGPFGSVAAGYVTEEEVDTAIDDARLDFDARFPEYAGANPYVHLTDDYVFWVPNGGWASGLHLDGNVFITLYTRGRSDTEPVGSWWIVRPPGELLGSYNDHYRYTDKPLIPAYKHEMLHSVIGDPEHLSPLWAMLSGPIPKSDGSAAGPYSCSVKF